MAEVEVMEAKAVAIEKQGSAEANVMGLKFKAEADGIKDKAESMKIFDEVGREHEEFKLKLNKVKEVELAEISVKKDIAQQQAVILGEALKSARIDIVGGDNIFFDRLVNSITNGKSVDRIVQNSEVLTDVKDTFFGDNHDETKQRIRDFVSQFGLGSEDVKNLTVSALVMKMIGKADKENKSVLNSVLSTVKEMGIAERPAREFI